jgi:hypothetical protein
VLALRANVLRHRHVNIVQDVEDLKEEVRAHMHNHTATLDRHGAGVQVQREETALQTMKENSQFVPHQHDHGIVC